MKTHVIRHHDGSKTKVNAIAKPKIGDWKVSQNDWTTNTNSLYFSGAHTRDNVRCAYAKITGAAFTDVTSERVKPVRKNRGRK